MLGRLAEGGHRDRAGISPFDSAVQGGDAVWEGLRLYDGRIFKLIEHLDRLPGGFAPSETGAELRLLARLFTPQEAELATHLTLDREGVRAIAARAGLAADEAARRLAARGTADSSASWTSCRSKNDLPPSTAKRRLAASKASLPRMAEAW